MTPQLIAMAEGRDAHVAQGACEALGVLKSVEAQPVLVRLLTHQDRWVRFKAAEALKRMGNGAKPALADMLKAVAQTREPLQPINWGDPVQLTHGQLAAALFSGPMSDSLKTTDRELVYPAVRAIANNADGMARATLRGSLRTSSRWKMCRRWRRIFLPPSKRPARRTRCLGMRFAWAGSRR